MLEFWYEFGSTYSYPAAMRMEGLAAAAGVEVIWRPFLLGPLFQRQGWNDSPYNVNPARGKYMWHDVARICARHGLPFRRPGVFPRRALLAARLGMIEEMTAHLPAFSRAVYRANFVEDRDLEDPATLTPILAGLGLDAASLLRRATEEPIKERLKLRTEEAWERGIVGAPTCIVGAELFWGQDRVEEALAWAAGGAGGFPGGAPVERAVTLVTRLGLEPHPEGGHYREIFRSGGGVAPEDGRGRRAGLTVIHFLLRRGEVSRWHRVRSDEAWQMLEGDGLELLTAPADLSAVEIVRLAPTGAGGVPVHVVPAGAWQAARPIGPYALVACNVGPGFDFADFEMMKDNPAAAAALQARWPGHVEAL